jgi:sugar phosphate isomerase/epimerase
MQAGIFAKTFSTRNVHENFAAARKAGFATVQFNMACAGLASMPDEISDETITEIREASLASGVSIAAVSATYNMIHPDPVQRKDGMRKLGVMMDAACKMGTGLLTLCTGSRDVQDQWRHHPENQSVEAWRDLRHEMDAAVRLAEAYSIDLGVEPESGNVVNDAAAARRLIDETGSLRIRIVLDPANLIDVATDKNSSDVVSRSIDLLGDFIVMAHAKDRDAAGRVVAAGEGVIDFPHFIGKLRRSGFSGPVIAHGLSEDKAPAVATFLKELIG